MNWIAQHSGQLAMALDIVLAALVVVSVRMSPRARRVLGEAIAGQVTEQLRPICEDVKAMRRDIADLRRGLHVDDPETADRIELVIVHHDHDEPAERN